MGDQAQQSQELELWQVVSSSRNTSTRRAKARSARTQTRSDMHKRGNGTRNAGPARPAKPRTGGAIRSEYARPIGAGAVRPAGRKAVRSEYAQPVYRARPTHARSQSVKPRTEGALRSEYARRPRSAGAVRPAGSRAVRSEYAQPVYKVRPGDAGTRSARSVRSGYAGAGAKAQMSKSKQSGRRARVHQVLALLWIALMCMAVFFMGSAFYKGKNKSSVVKADKPIEQPLPEEPMTVEDTGKKPNIREDFLTISEYNRPGTTLACVKNIFVHYTANPKTSAAQNRSYFENLGQTHERAASAHFIIGYEGEVIQCIPLDEEAYAVVERNGDSISIECCYLAQDGSFTQETYDSLVEMLAWLLDKYDLEPKDILRHYDCGGKLCPVYYVKHEDAWQKLLGDVAAELESKYTL